MVLAGITRHNVCIVHFFIGGGGGGGRGLSVQFGDLSRTHWRLLGVHLDSCPEYTGGYH